MPTTQASSGQLAAIEATSAGLPSKTHHGRTCYAMKMLASQTTISRLRSRLTHHPHLAPTRCKHRVGATDGRCVALEDTNEPHVTWRDP